VISLPRFRIFPFHGRDARLDQFDLSVKLWQHAPAFSYFVDENTIVFTFTCFISISSHETNGVIQCLFFFVDAKTGRIKFQTVFVDPNCLWFGARQKV
jgi:hypothetical protein